ncbi:uncharacterized protein TNCV_2671661 [Trichonephila clavipes]|nr:uncharacterized protein TNCV_2671661 [Trichonephila clavipes]
MTPCGRSCHSLCICAVNSPVSQDGCSCLPSASRHALLAKDLVTWQAMVGRHILEDIVGRVAQYVDEQQRPTSFTKRMVLSTIARIFDPLGLLGPIITWAKIFMQRLWLLELGWSDELPFKEEKEWRRFIDSLEAMNNISIDR